MKTRIFIITTICSLIAAGCMMDLTDAGPGSETTNGKIIAGAAVLSYGTPPDQTNNAHQTIVRLLPRGYNPATDLPLPDNMTDTTDSRGNYVFKILNTGVFNIQAVNTASGERLLVRDIPVFADTTIVPSDTLRMPGTINIMLPDDADAQSGYVYIPGTTIFALLKNTEGDIATLDEVPSNVLFPINYGASTPGSAQRTLMENVLVSPGGNITTLYTSWKHFRKVVINTTPSGANVMHTVYDFPLLIRLDNSNFVFSEAQANGNDLVFTKADHSELPFEIERWDPVNGRAEIWVRVDTVFGNNATQQILMYWGNSGATETSNGPAVFDTAHGFQSVWHLADNAANSFVRDAVGKNNGTFKSGTAETNTSSATTTGFIRSGLKFTSADSQWIDLGADKPFINGRKEITLSLWVNVYNYSGDNQELLCFSKGSALTATAPESRAGIAISNNKLILHARPVDNKAYWNMMSTRTVALHQWYHIVGIIKVPQDSMYLYVNGELWNKMYANFGATMTELTNSVSSAIGSNDIGKSNYFNGYLDEVRVETTARSTDWIKLSYWSQSHTSVLIGLK